MFSSVFSMQVRGGNVRTQPRRGSGPLYDIGVYCVNAARYLFRTEPVEVTAMKLAGRDPRFAAVDEAFAVTLRFPQERVAQFTCSFGAHDRARYELVGSAGTLVLENSYEYEKPMVMHVDGVHGKRDRTFEVRDQVAAEIEYFARCVHDDTEPEPGGYEGLADVRILQAIQASARFGRSVTIEPVPRIHRPDLGQSIAVEPHAPAPLVDVESASR